MARVVGGPGRITHPPSVDSPTDAEEDAMAPEMVARLIVLDLAEGRAPSARHIASLVGKDRFLVKWYPLKATPKGFKSVAGGVVYVPDEVTVAEDQLPIQCTPRSCRYKDDADMLVLLLPRGQTLSWHRMPWAAKEWHGRVAVYWLRPDPTQLVEVVWALRTSDADAGTVAEDLNSFVEDERGEIPSFSVDRYQHYDVALSYAGEDRPRAEEIARALQRAGKRVFFDHDLRSSLWGKALGEELDAIFSKRSTCCVLLVSAHYKMKRWTLEELQAAVKGAARSQRRDYILPVRLDATTLEGLPDDIVYVPIDQGTEVICSYILEKLGRA
jgi:hypothetical protein